MANVWLRRRGTDIFPRGTFDGPWAFFQKRAAVHANTGVRKIIEEGLDYERLEDAIIPVEVVTTSLTDGRERWIGHGPATEAILASSAIPSIFPPVVIDGDLLVDGGVVNNVPISRALAAGCDRIYVLLCGPLHYHPPPPRRPAEAALTAFFVAIHARFVRELDRAAGGGRGDRLQWWRRSLGPVPRLLGHGRSHRGRPRRGPRHPRPLHRDLTGPGPAAEPAAPHRRTRPGGPRTRRSRHGNPPRRPFLRGPSCPGRSHPAPPAPPSPTSSSRSGP